MILLVLVLSSCAGPKSADDTAAEADADTDTDADTDADTDTTDTTDTDDTDPDDTDTDIDTADTARGESPIIWSMNGVCGSRTCTWTVEARGSLGRVTLDLIETGDAAYECPPGVECNVWHERHDAFVLVDADDDGETKEITLGLTTDTASQVANSTTVFDVSESRTANQLTVLFVIEDADGDYADCATYGHRPEHFFDVCTNNANEW